MVYFKGVVILLINIRLQGQSSLERLSNITKGKYFDFNTEWYRRVGTVIIY